MDQKLYSGRLGQKLGLSSAKKSDLLGGSNLGGMSSRKAKPFLDDNSMQDMDAMSELNVRRIGGDDSSVGDESFLEVN